MPKVITTTVYEYQELSDKAKGRARDWWRQGETDTYWAESVTEQLKHVALFMGWTITGTGFSGFSCQGDGAHFEGTWSAANVQIDKLEPLFRRADSEANARLHGIAERFAMLAQGNHSAQASVRHRGRYQHSNCTVFSEDDAWTDMQTDEFVSASRALMDWYFRALDGEYEHHTSDDNVADSIIANDYTFTAEGKRFG